MKTVSSWLLRISLSAILFMHSVPGMFNGGVNAFGSQYLAPLGFGWLGLPLAWVIKLAHVFFIYSLFTGFWVRWIGWVNVAIFAVGIVLVHAPSGWFVVGGGTNGVEFNILLICTTLYVMHRKDWRTN